MLEPGTQVGGYRIDEFLAAGGMGAVYRATQLSLNRAVALKVISESLGQDPTFRARFRREAVLQAALEHPHIVTVYEAGKSDQGLFIAMRFIAGASLEGLMPRLARAHAIRLLEGVAAALDAAHAAGIVHRDVKPSNVLVATADDHAFLADFGLTTATGLSSMTSAGQFLGTVDYVSPEQIRDEEPDARSDIYSFGAVLYRCLTGSVPFPRSTKVAVIYAQLEQLPEPASSRAPELPAALDPVLARALAKNPADRFATAGSLIAAARAALGDHPSGELTPPMNASDASTRRKSTTTAESATTAAITAPVSATAVQRRPKPGRDPRGAPGGRALGIRALGVGGVLALTVIAGLAAYLVRHNSASTSSLGPTQPLTAGPVAVQVPTSWTQRSLTLPQLFPANVATAAAAARGTGRGAGLAIGLTRGFGPSMLPLPLQAVPGALNATPRRVVTRTGLQGLEYSFAGGRTDTPTLSVPAHRYEILFVPTGHLVATVACIAPARRGVQGAAANRGATSNPGPTVDQRTAALLSACQQVMATVTDSGKLGLDPRNEYAAFLSDVFTALSRTEANGLATLASAPTPGAQAAAANRIATAFTNAQTSFRRFVGHGLSSPELGLQIGLRNQLGVIAGDYHALAAAAAAGNAGAYPAASTQVKHDRAVLSDQIYQLTRGGYTLAP